jgi:hypothetical protein
MSLLSICQAASVEIGVDYPATIIGSGDPTARRLLRYATKVGHRLMKAFDWQVLQAVYSDTAGDLNGVDLAALILASGSPGPTFDRFMTDATWDRSNNRLIKGPISINEFRGLNVVSDAVTGAPEKFILRNKQMFFYPVGVGSTVDVSIEYIRGDWINQTATAFAADSDTVKLDEELITLGVIYEFLKGQGLPYGDVMADYLAMFDQLTGNEYPSSGVLVSGDLWNNGRNYSGEAPVAPNRSLLLA